jgi:hypothetical protein
MQADKKIYPGIYPYADEWPLLLRNGALIEERSVRAEVLLSWKRFGMSLSQACLELKSSLAGAVRLARTKRRSHFVARSISEQRRWWRGCEPGELGGLPSHEWGSAQLPGLQPATPFEPEYGSDGAERNQR